MNEDWLPPIGIPAPPFGITQDVTMYLNSGVYTYDYSDDGATGAVPYRTAHGLPYTYYVNRLHTGATNTNNIHGSPDRPRTSWVYPLNSGDVVQLHGTGYNFSNAPSLSMAFGGTGHIDRPIFLTSTGAIGDTGNYPTINRGVAGQSMYIYGNYTIVEKVRAADDSTFSTRPLLKGAPALYVCVRDCLFDGNGDTSAGTCINTGGSLGNSVDNYTDYIIVFRCEMRNYGDWTRLDLEIDACACIFSENALHCWMLDCLAHHINGDGVRLGADQGSTASGGFYYVGRCTFHHNKENGVDIKQADNAVISECIMHDFVDSESSGGEAVVIHYNPSNIWFINNIVYNCDRGFVSTGASEEHIYLIGNIVYNALDIAIYIDRGGGRFHVIANTVHDCAEGIISTGSINEVDIHNNIVYDITGSYLRIENSLVAAGRQTELSIIESTSGTITQSGNATVIVSGDSIAGTPLTFNVAVLVGDTAAQYAVKIAAALAANSAINSVYTVTSGGSGAADGTVTFTVITVAAHDANLNISIDNGTCLGIIPTLTSHALVYGKPTGSERASHELYFESSGGAVSISWSGATYTSVAAWISAQDGVGDNSLEQDPLFIDAPSRNYRLQENSPAKNVGYDWTAIDTTFQSFFGVSMLRDIDGVVRPQGGIFDLGAYEFLQTATRIARLVRMRSTNVKRISFGSV